MNSIRWENPAPIKKKERKKEIHRWISTLAEVCVNYVQAVTYCYILHVTKKEGTISNIFVCE